jgi:hypothetical protein
MMPKTRTRNTIFAALALAAFAFTARAAFAEEVKLPTTTAEHEAIAKQYRDQAAQYKKMADDHRAMAAAYAKSHPPTKSSPANPWALKMQKHCDMLAKDADKLSADATKAADYHDMRAKELEGK